MSGLRHLPRVLLCTLALGCVSETPSSNPDGPDEKAAASGAPISVLSGANAVAVMGDTITVRLQVVDREGRPAPYVAIGHWVHSGSGKIVEATPTATNAAGQLTLRWILGPFPGKQEIQVSGLLVSATATGQLEPWKFRAITGNGASTCAVALDGRAYCWAGSIWSAGLNYELGNGSNQRPAPMPQPVAGQLTWIDLSMVGGKTWGIASDGSLYWWGTSMYPTPWEVAKTPTAGPRGRWRQIVQGGDHQCATDELQQAYCWGRGAEGQLGTGARDDKTAPSLVAGGHKWRQLAAGARYTCGITVEDLGHCWGRWSGTPDARLVPTSVYANERLRSITMGCAVTVQGWALCGPSSPLRVAPGYDWQVYVEDEGSAGARGCGITTDARLHCWKTSTGSLVAVRPDLQWQAVAGGCALTKQDEVYCWQPNVAGPGAENWTGTDVERPILVYRRIIRP
jgi:hypothetical protein